MANPSLSQIDSCRKADLVQLADHCSLTYSKQLREKELKALVIGKLVELEVIVLPAQSEPAVFVDGTLSEAGSKKLEGEPHNAHTALGVSERMKMRFTPPHYDHLSSPNGSPADGTNQTSAVAISVCD